ncbi:MAG: hypothetical protein U0R21_09855 [Nocardioidaceae bacterium]
MPPISVNLLVLGSVLELELTGSGAALIEPTIRDAWSWCVSDLDLPATVRVRAAYDVGDDLAAFMQWLTQSINYAVIESQAGQLMMFHACTLADSQGRVAALIAPSGTGKTTAAVALGRDFGYLSDETAGVLPDGTVVPYPKPLSIIETPGQPKVQADPGEFFGAQPTGPFALKALIYLSRRDQGPMEVEEVPLLESLALLAPQTSFLSKLDQPLHRLADLVESCGGVHLAHYADTADLGPLVRRLLEAR